MLVMVDLDNTLGDRQRAVESWATEFVVRHGWDTDRIEWLLSLDNDGYSSRAEVFRTIANELGHDRPDELLADYQRRIIELTQPVPGARHFLRELRRLGHTIVILTNGSTRQQEAKIDHLGLRDVVDGVVVSETVGTKKPAAEIFELAASEVGADLAEGWMVGDSAHHDILGARRLGLRTAWIPRGRVWDPDLAEPDIIVDDLPDLAAQIDGTPLRSTPIALPIRTERLVIHALSEPDIDGVHAILGDGETTRSVSFGQPDREATAGHVRRRIEQQRTLAFSMWAIRVSGDEEIVGLCGFFPHDDSTVELGYVIRADRWRNGFATEAASAAVEAATGVGLDVMATIRPANAGSLEVAHRAGLIRGETITDDRGELVVFRASGAST